MLGSDLRSALLRRVLDAAGAPPRPDNLDWLVHPSGPPEPDPDLAHVRLGDVLDQLPALATTWELLADEPSRATLVAVLAQRVLGPARVVLDLEPRAYRETVAELHTRGLLQVGTVQQPQTPLEWTINSYSLSPFGINAVVTGNGLPVAQTYLLGQYALRHDRAVGPWPGDHALDVGACWGETAIWLAHTVGGDGHVTAFEPAPVNRQILAGNLETNPDLAPRITVRDDLLGASTGLPMAFPLAGAGAHGRPVEAAEEAGFVRLETVRIDDVLPALDPRQVDFVKIDVEGAELDVLEGARELLSRDRPRLAIAAYHRPEDLAAIPTFLHQLDLGYRLYLQASTLCEVDVVLFAVAGGRDL